MGPEESSTESATMPSEVLDLRKSLDRALGDVAALRVDLAAARDEIDQLKAENTKLRADAVTRSGEDVKIGQTQEIQGNVEFKQKARTSTAVSAVPNGDATPNPPSDEENSAPSADNGDVEEAGTRHKTNNPDKENNNANAPSDEDEDEDEGDSASDSSSDKEDSDNDDDEADGSPQSPPTTPADDIRLRAARTLIWADSAIKRAEAMKDQQQQDSAAGTPRGSVRDMSEHSTSGMDNNATRSVGSRTRLPATVQIADTEDSESDDDSVLSEDDYSARGGGGGSATRKAGPFANFRNFIEDAIDDVADRLVPLEDGLNGGSNSNLPPLSPTNLKYCNEAMKRKLNGASGGGDDADSRSTARTPVSVRIPLDDGSSCADGTDSTAAKPKPMMNEAMMRLSSEKKKKGLGSRLFSS